MNPSLHELKNRQLIWQAREQSVQEGGTIASGYTTLDEKLQGGWPEQGIIEIIPERYGIGELRLLLPALEQLSQSSKLQAWVNPPARLTPENLGSKHLRQNLIVRPSKQRDICWIAEQLLGSGCCASLVGWVKSMTPAQAKRLQLAAKSSATPGFIISNKRPEQSLALSMRLSVSACQRGLQINIFKRQNGRPIEPFQVDLSQRWPQLFTETAKAPISDNRHQSESAHISIQDRTVIPFPRPNLPANTTTDPVPNES